MNVMLDECYVDEEFIVPFPCQIYIFSLFYVVYMTIYTFLMHILKNFGYPWNSSDNSLKFQIHQDPK